MTGNHIRKIEGALNFYGSLETLDLSSNQFRHVGKRQFSNQRNLQILNLSSNFLTSLMDHSFQGPDNLQILDLSKNVISELTNDTFVGLHSLVELRLSHNLLQTVHFDAFRGLTRLRVLSVERNKLATLSPDWLWPLQNLRFLYAADNEIVDLPADAFKALSALKVLELRRNQISDNLSKFCFRGSRALDTVDLSFNQLKAVPNEALAHLVQLSQLDLSGNPVSELTSHSLQNLHLLEVLTLSNSSNFVKIHGNAFKDNVKLSKLFIEFNPNLEPLPWGLFDDGSSVEVLGLRGNSWSTLSPRQLPVNSMKQLHISGLPLNCNCSVVWLWDLYHRNDSRLDLDEVSCQSVASARDGPGGEKRGGDPGDALRLMVQDQLICSTVSRVLVIISISVIILVLIFVIFFIIVLKWRQYRFKRHAYGGASCLKFDDDTIVYKSALRGGYLPTTATHGLQGAAYSPSEEPLYEVPKFGDAKSSVSSSGGSSSKYSSSGLVGSELWESDFFGSPAHCYTNPSVQRLATTNGLTGSPQSTSTIVSSSNTGSSSNSSSTASSNHPHTTATDFKPVFFSPQRHHVNNTMMLPLRQPHHSIGLTNSPPSPAPGGDLRSNTLMMRQYHRGSPLLKKPPASTQTRPLATGSLRSKSSTRNLFV